MRVVIRPVAARLLTAIIVLLLLAGGAVAQTRQGAPDRIAFLARADNPVDALSASAVAAQLGGVVLLTSSTQLSAEAAEGLVAFEPDLVVLAGGTGALSGAVQEQVEALGFVTERVAGTSRLETAQRMAAFLSGKDLAFLPADGTAVGAQEALHADEADTAVHAQSAITATTAETATTAQSAVTAESLNGYAPDELVRSWWQTATGTVPIGDGILAYVDVISVTVDAPSDGWLVLQGGAVVQGGNTVTTVACVPALDGQQVVGAGGGGASSPVLGVQFVACRVGGMVAVTAGVHTLTLEVTGATANQMTAGNRGIGALFVPFGSGS